MNLFELFVKIGVDDQASSKIGNISSKLGNGLKTAAKIGTAAVGAASTAIVALTKQAVENYAEYEQLVGGVETLFAGTKESYWDFVDAMMAEGATLDEANKKWAEVQKGQTTVLENAANAYKTAGLSANDYMSTVTSFSASLIQSLGGDTVKAAEYADIAITDMADNANKMGTSMEMLQTTYAGFAKQNFTMLDNLKLGYGGTKEEMQRLLEDAEKLSGIKYDISSFADITSAIHVLQEEMGIAGATALEASTTIEGSLNSMKGAWQNLLTGMADEESRFSGLIDNFVESTVTVADNLLPRIEVSLNGVSQLIGELFPVIMEKVPSIIESTLPNVANSAVKIVESFISGITENQETLIATIMDVGVLLMNSFISMLPQIIQLGFDLIVSLATGIAENLDTLIPSVMDAILKIVDTLTNPENLTKLLDAALILITELAFGLMEATPQLVNAVFDIVDSIIVFLTDPENLAKLLNAGLKLLMAVLSGIISSIPRILSELKTLRKKIFDSWGETDWGQVGRNIIDGLKVGIQRAWNNLKTWFKGLFGDLIGIAKKILGIASPSKVFKRLGGWTAEGFGIGFEDTFGDVEDDIENALDFGDADYGITTSTSSIASQGGFADRNSYATQNVNVTVGIDETANPMGLARALLPFLKIAEKEVYA